jgi:hypothetical protein
VEIRAVPTVAAETVQAAVEAVAETALDGPPKPETVPAAVVPTPLQNGNNE